jgi:hypothetical protein
VNGLGGPALETDLFLNPNLRKEEDIASKLDGAALIDTSAVEPRAPTIGRLRFVRRDQRSSHAP